MRRIPLNKDKIKKTSFLQNIWISILSIFSMIKIFFDTFFNNEKDMKIRREFDRIRNRTDSFKNDPIKFGCGPSG